MIMPGHCGLARLRIAMMAMVATERPIAVGLAVLSASKRTGSFWASGPGSAPSTLSPRSSLTWLAKMMMAIPAVNPTVTG